MAGPQHKVSLDVALRAVTIDAAYSIQMEKRVGSIEVGKDANLTILGSNQNYAEMNNYKVVEGRFITKEDVMAKAKVVILGATDSPQNNAMAQVTTYTPEQARALHGHPGVQFVDVRDIRELEREGVIPGAIHAPRGMLEFWVDPASPYHKKIFSEPGKRYVLFCAAGWRSALSTLTMLQMGIDIVRISPQQAHINEIIAAFDAARRGAGADAAAAWNAEGLVNGFWHGKAGIEVNVVLMLLNLLPILPLDGGRSPESRLISVVLPAPFGPITACTSADRASPHQRSRTRSSRSFRAARRRRAA
mgnify:CR=1 FL=1